MPGDMRINPVARHCCGVTVGLLLISFCLLSPAAAQTEIHKCTDADGGISYSQLPCAPPKPAKPAPDTAPDSATPQAREPNALAAARPENARKPDVRREACKKRYRDAIDEIDAEIAREYTPEKAADYKQRLLILTRKLRQC